MGKIRFFLTEALGSLRRNYFMTIAAVVTVFLSMSVLGVVMVFAYNIDAVLKDVEQKVEITIFLKDSATAQEIESMQKEIVGLPQVKQAAFVSKDEALKRLRVDLKDHPEILESLSGQPAPRLLRGLVAGPQDGRRGGEAFRRPTHRRRGALRQGDRGAHLPGHLR